MNPYDGAELFGVVRNPYERAVSEFYYICSLKVLDWRPDQCDRSKLFNASYMNQWLRDKMNDREEHSALAYLSDNGHFTPQHQFVVGPYDVRMVDYVLHLDENLEEEFHQLMKAFRLYRVRLKKMNAISAEARDTDRHLTVADLDDETHEVINRLFRRDFELGYSQVNSRRPNAAAVDKV
jgi:Sulfotransferase family